MVAESDRRKHVESVLALAGQVRTRSHRLFADAMAELLVSVIARGVSDEIRSTPARFRAWVHGALRRRLSNALRRERRRRETALTEGELPCAQQPDEQERVEEAECVRTTLDEMRDTGFAAAADLLAWRWLDGESVAEIAQRLGTDARRVTYRLRHAKEAFRIAWAQRGGHKRERYRSGVARKFRATGDTVSEANDFPNWSATHEGARFEGGATVPSLLLLNGCNQLVATAPGAESRWCARDNRGQRYLHGTRP